MPVRKKISLFILIFVTVLFISGCGGGGGGSSSSTLTENQVRFNASIASNLYSKSVIRLSDSAIAADIHIVAIPVDGFRTCIKDDNGTSFLKEVTLNSDNTFSMDLDKKISVIHDGSSYELYVDYVLLLVDTTKSTKDRVIRFISMGNFNTNSEGDINLGTSGSLSTVVKLPLSAASGIINAGALTQANDNEAESSSATGGSFTLNSNQLKMIARSDDVAKSVKNDYLNPDLETKVFYYWYDSSIITDITSLESGFSDPSNFRFYGCAINFWEQSWSAGILGSFDSIRNLSTTLALYPPSTVYSAASKTYSATVPISNNTTMTGSNYYYNDDDFSVFIDDSRLGCCFGNGSNNLTSLPSGEWVLKKDGVQIGSYDFNIGNPFVTKSAPVTSKIMAYVPALKLTVDGSNNITKLEIKWYLWDGTAYQEVTDLSILERDGYDSGVCFDNSTGQIIYSSDNSEISKVSYTTSDFGTINLSNVRDIRLELNAGPFAYSYRWGSN